MEVFSDFDRPARASLYAVAGRLLFIECREERLAKLIEGLFDGWFLTKVSFSPKHPDVSIRFHCRETPPQIPRGFNHFEVAEGGCCYTVGDAYYLDLDNSVMLIDQGDDAVRVELWLRRCPDFPDAPLARATSFAVCAALRRCGLFELHSAGVTSPDEKTGALIIGPSGSGKSTLTLQLATAGWRYLSDDELLLSLGGDQVEARGFRRFFAITENTAAAAGGLGKFDKLVVRRGNMPDSKRCFEPEMLFPSAQIESVVPRLLFFSSLSRTSDTRLLELSQAETMKRLIRSCPWATYDACVAAENLDVLSRLARQSRSFDLLAGTDLLRSNHASDLLSAYITD
jgi:hypothetical protein